MGDPLFRNMIRFVSSVHRIANEMSRGVRSDVITPLQYSMLEYIAVSQPVTVGSISECIHMSMPNTSRELRKLTEKGLCERLSEPADRRRTSIRLSAEGQRMMDAAFREIEIRFMARMNGLSAKDRTDVERAMELLQTKLFT